jgi:hypothetical protein
MDILNFISWIKGGRVVTSVDPTQTLLPVGLKDSRRDDGYLAGAITVSDFAAQLVPAPAYKVYTAILNQSGTSAPVATVLENTIDATLLWTYSSVGNYIFSLPSFPSGSPFIVGKTFVHIGSTTTGPLALYANNNTSMGVPQNNGIVVKNYNTLFANTNNFTNVSIEIRVYT